MLKKMCVDLVDVEQSILMVSSALESNDTNAQGAACICRVLAEKLSTMVDSMASIVLTPPAQESSGPSSFQTPETQG